MIANLLAMTAALGLPAKLFCGFVDAKVNGLLDLDTRREVALTLLSVGQTEARAPAPIVAPPLNLETVPLSKQEVDYPLMRAMHEASSLATAPWQTEPRPLGSGLREPVSQTDTIE